MQVESEYIYKIWQSGCYGERKMFELFMKLKIRALALNQRDMHRENVEEEKAF